MEFIDYQNVHEMLKAVIEENGDLTAYRWFVDDQGNMEGVTWNQFYQQARQLSKSLMALGVKKNDKINIISSPCYKWVLCDIGIIFAGGCTVGIYRSNLPKDCQYIIDHSDAVLIFVEDDEQLQKIMTIRKEIPKIEKVVMFGGHVPPDDDWVIGFEEFLKLGDSISDEAFLARNADLRPEDPATIVYTSGTTGIPKGAVITHDNLIFNAQSVKGSLVTEKGDQTIVFLPLAHIFARVTVYASAITGGTVNFARSVDSVVEDIGLIRPHWMPSVPRIYEKIYSKVVSGAQDKGGVVLKLFNWACRVGNEVSDCILNKQPIPAFTRFQYAIATKLVFSKLQKVLGGNIRWMLSGAAPLNESIAKFFHAAGILVLEGIGMTENTSFSHTNRFDNFRFGWVGLPGPGIECKLGDDGEILIRGRNVMKEYYKMPKETTNTFTKDGWLMTGDLGEIDATGFLKVTGRKKELIITAGGKNIAPSYLEGVIGTSTFINQVMVVGDRKKYLTALVTLDPLTVSDYAVKNGIAYQNFNELIAHPAIVALVEKEIAEKNKNFASFETIKKVAIVPEFDIQNGLITPTMKLKKNIITELYKDKIEALYPDN
ncbi:MAG: long-chain fatty acid--CoA ligase [bacterium]